jgi:uncharacterized protein (DUF1697 family)
MSSKVQMDRYVAFLRGMNLGGRRITNDALRAHFKALGCEKVATFRASGNVIFAKDGRSAELTTQLEVGLFEALGYEVPVFLRSAGELLAIAEYEPFDKRHLNASKGKLQIALLTKKPSSAATKKALALATDADRLAIKGRELYWLPKGGMSESELDLKALATLLGPTTIRTKGTVDQIAARHFA